MAKRAMRDEILDQIRRMPLEDRDYIEAELVRRAHDSLARSDGGVSREEAIARARAVVEAVRARNK